MEVHYEKKYYFSVICDYRSSINVYRSAEMGDVMTLNAIAEEIKSQSDTCVPLSKRIVQLAEDIDLDGIEKLADALDAS